MFLIVLSVFVTIPILPTTVPVETVSQMQTAQNPNVIPSSRSSIGRSSSSRIRSSSSSVPRQYSSRVYSSSVRSFSSSRGSSASSILPVLHLKTQELKTAHPAIQDVMLQDDKISVDYQSDAHLFGFIPISMPLHIEVTKNGVEVKKPWWGFLASDKAAVIKASVSASLTDGMGEEALIQSLMNAFDKAE